MISTGSIDDAVVAGSPQTSQEASMDSTPMTTGRGGRFRTPHQPTAEEKRQASEVSLGRIARLFTPYRWPVLGVVAIIVAASIVGLASPFLLRGIIDTALPQQDLRLL